MSNKVALITGITGQDDANRLVGNGQYLRKFTNPKNVFSLDDTLRWMLS